MQRSQHIAHPLRQIRPRPAAAVFDISTLRRPRQHQRNSPQNPATQKSHPRQQPHRPQPQHIRRHRHRLKRLLLRHLIKSLQESSNPRLMQLNRQPMRCIPNRKAPRPQGKHHFIVPAIRMPSRPEIPKRRMNQVIHLQPAADVPDKRSERHHRHPPRNQSQEIDQSIKPRRLRIERMRIAPKLQPHPLAQMQKLIPLPRRKRAQPPWHHQQWPKPHRHNRNKNRPQQFRRINLIRPHQTLQQRPRKIIRTIHRLCHFSLRRARSSHGTVLMTPDIERISIHVLQAYHIAARCTATRCICPIGCPHRRQNFAVTGFAALHRSFPHTRVAPFAADIIRPRPVPPLSADPARHANFKTENITHPPNNTAVTPVIAMNRKMVKKISPMTLTMKYDR